MIYKEIFRFVNSIFCYILYIHIKSPCSNPSHLPFNNSTSITKISHPPNRGFQSSLHGTINIVMTVLLFLSILFYVFACNSTRFVAFATRLNLRKQTVETEHTIVADYILLANFNDRLFRVTSVLAVYCIRFPCSIVKPASRQLHL